MTCKYSGCSNLTTITIPISVKITDNTSFKDCPIIEVYMNIVNFANTNSTASILTPTKYFYDGKELKGDIEIPDNVTELGYGVLKSAKNITSVIIPNSVTKINSGAFSNCTGLTSITIPNSVTSIASAAFSGCTNLTSVIIPSCVTSIGENAFGSCTSLTSVIIPNSVTSIEYNAFKGCSNLASVVISKSVTSIGGAAFSGCKLSSITIMATTVPKLGKDVFSPQSLYHSTLLVPRGTWNDYAYDDNWYAFHTIRETMFAADDVSEARAFTIKASDANSYLCYDKVNEVLGTVNVEGLDEDEPNNAWMLATVDGKQYIYNLGSKKFLAVAKNNAKARRVASDGTQFVLTDEPMPVTLSNGEDGISVDGAGEFYFVINNNLNIDNSVTSRIEEATGISQLTTDERDASVYNLNGQKVNDDYRGIIIKNGKKIFTK